MRGSILGNLLNKYLMRATMPLIKSRKGLVVLTLHNITEDHHEWFKNLLELIRREYSFAEPDDLEKWFMQNNLERGTKVLLSFDDGFYSNIVITEKYLREFGVKAMYFITEKFIGLDSEASFSFAKNNFFPNSDISTNNKNSFSSMSWNDVKRLIELGHVIGGHSSTHQRLSTLTDANKIVDETISSSDRISDLIGQQVTHYAFPFGKHNSIDSKILDSLIYRYKYIYSNIRGNLNDSVNSQFIYRQNIVPGDPNWLIKSIIDGKLDWRYRNIRKYCNRKIEQLTK